MESKTSNFGSDYCNSYVVTVNGNQIVYSSSNKKPAFRLAETLAKSGDYVELWYQHSNFNCVLVQYWN